MASFTDRLPARDRIDARYVVLGVALALGSVAFSGWSLLNNDISTGFAVLLYVVVGALLIGIGTSPEPSSEPE